MSELEKSAEQQAEQKPKAAKRAGWVIPVIVASAAVLVLALVAVAAYFGFYLPWSGAVSEMPPSGSMLLTVNEDGSALLEWPAAQGADSYLVSLQRTGEAEPFYAQEVTDGTSCLLSQLPLGEVTLRVLPVARYATWFGERTREGETDLAATALLAIPELEDLEWEVDENDDVLTVSCKLQAGQVCCVSSALEDGTLWEKQWTQAPIRLSFGEEKDLPMPTYDTPCSLSVRSYIDMPGLRICAPEQMGFLVSREDLLGTELKLECVDEGHNRYTLTWNETKGEHYEIQRYDAKTQAWKTVASIPRDEALSYDTGHLDRYTDYRFRVVALGGQMMPDSDYAAVPSEVELSTGASLIYSTVWPIQDLTVYSDAEKTSELGTAKAAGAYCVLDEENGLFRVRFGQGYGYIDSNYCMINLPEYLGDLCSYDITNSYEAIYMVHGYEISGITGEVVDGYQRVKVGANSYLVPLLYPTAQKLEKAAFSAREQGYRLKIYDSYRPGIASVTVREATSQMLPQLIPEQTFTGEVMEDMPDVPIQGTASDPALSGGAGEEGAEGEEDGDIIEYLTYEYLMTDNGRLALNYFIAGFGSRHNFGVAMDMTLERLSNREEMEMQSDIHDLSHYSELQKNNRNANILSSIMINAGFGGLVSEWWHFQDNEAFNELKPEKLWDAVTPECWMADDNGWRYRKANGTWYTDCTAEIDGVSYTFDAHGYVTQNP